MNWDNAKKWVETANDGKDIQEIDPHWNFDCGLKLDYDGGLLHVSSRFYQESTDIYNGSVSFCIGDDELFNREFSCRHIDILKEDVEQYVKTITEQFKCLCKSNLSVFIEGKGKP